MCCYYVHYSEHRKKGRKVRKNQPTERFKWEHLKGARGGGVDDPNFRTDFENLVSR